MFVLTLPVIFEYTNLLSPIALMVILSTMMGILYIIAPYPVQISHNESVDTQALDADASQSYHHQKYPFLYQAWYGVVPLWLVFWPYFIIVNLVLYASDLAVRDTALSVPTWDNILLVCVVTAIWWSIGVWRMSAFCQFRIYSTAARLATLTLFSDFILRVFIRIKYPRVFFDCEGMLFDYSSCF